VEVPVTTWEILDTFPAFLAFWESAHHKSLDAQIDAWVSDYMDMWPELLYTQVQAYATENTDWRQVARERIFPFLDERLPAMKVAHRNLLDVCRPIASTARTSLGFDSDIEFVIYVGIGCGAGWATRYCSKPAVLFGLENIAECGWTTASALIGLTAHEIGHLAHTQWREQAGEVKGSGPLWQLYEEGFAQRCEHVVLGKESWHMVSDVYGKDWLEWCQKRKRWLAAEFLRRVDAGESVRPFFGSWFDIEGRKQCGYYLGHELIKVLEEIMDLQEIALLDSEDTRILGVLEEMSRN
jgi:hypothetical protein